MDSLLGSFATVDPAEFADLAPLSPITLAEQLETVRMELEEFESWLGCPPPLGEATTEDIQAKLSLWDQARQWLFAYQAELEKKQAEIADLDEELAEIRGEMRGLEAEQNLSHDDSAAGGATRGHRPMSHDEQAAADAYWDELDQRENRILRRLDQLGAPLPISDHEPASAPVDTRSHIQRGLDQEWASANFAGQGCPFCDSLFGGCGCWAQRREAQEAEERRRVRESRAEVAARIARGECACDALEHEDYPSLCEVCDLEESLRCRECGSCPCRAGCCGGCGSCTRCRGDPCKGCGGWENDCHCYDDDGEDYDPSDPYGDGAPEEHEGHPGYDGGCW
jgi:hypothetical protein